MSIVLECECGKRFRGKDEYVGRQMKCPVCGRLLVIKKTETLADSSGPATEQHSAAAAGSSPPERRKGGSPLNDTEQDELRETEAFRRRIRHAAILFRIQFLANLVVSIIMLLMMLLTFSTREFSVPAGFVTIIIQFGSVFLLYMAYKATWDCRRWAPITMFVLNILFAALLVLAAFAASRDPRSDGLVLMGVIAPAIVPVVLAIICYRAWDAIPKFLAQPAWCQNTLLYCGL
jgi:hypothetical protein